MTKSYEIDMCHGPILRKIILFAFPLLCTFLLQFFFTAIDIIVVGRFAGSNSLAAVGSNSSLINLMINLLVGLSIGANIITSKYYGAGQKEELSKAIHTSMAMSLWGGLILTVLGTMLAGTFLRWMQTPEEVLGLATLYLRIYFLGIIPTIVYNFGSAVMRAVGDTRRPLIFLIIAGIIKILFNLLFVIKFKWDVAGVATATIISQSIASAMIIFCMKRDRGSLKLDIRQIRLHKEQMLLIMKNGIPAGIQGMVFSLANVVILSSINLFGATVMAGNAASMNMEYLVYFSMHAFYLATISFTGQNMGAGNYRRIIKVQHTAMGCIVVAGIVSGGLLYLFGRQAAGLYSTDPAVIDAAMLRLKFICLPYFICGIMEVLVGSLRGMGYSMMPTVVSIIGACIFRIVWVNTIFTIPEFHTREVIYAVFPISWIITSAAHYICFIFAMKKLVYSRIDKASRRVGSSLKK